MQSRSPSWLSAALVACLLPAGARAQVIPFGPYFGPGLSSSDNQMVFESAARVNAAAPGKVGQSDSWRNPQTKSHSSSTITRVFTSGAMPCHWCAITSSQAHGRLAITASPGAARQAASGRSRVDPAPRAPGPQPFQFHSLVVSLWPSIDPRPASDRSVLPRRTSP
jgi:hypothetical protein